MTTTVSPVASSSRLPSPVKAEPKSPRSNGHCSSDEGDDQDDMDVENENESQAAEESDGESDAEDGVVVYGRFFLVSLLNLVDLR